MRGSKLRTSIALLIIMMCGIVAGNAQNLDDLPQYKPAKKVSGTIRLWGHGSPDTDFMGKLVNYWIAGFQKLSAGCQIRQPAVWHSFGNRRTLYGCGRLGDYGTRNQTV